MPFSFADAKKLVRRTVHKTFAVPALYQADSVSTPVACKARWHSKIEKTGDLDNEGWAQVIEGIDRVIFDVDEATTLGVSRGGKIIFPDLGNIAFELDTQEDPDGPIEEIWLVTLVR